MDLFIRIGLYVFICYTPVLLFLFFLATKKYDEYSIRTHWMSDLGDTRYTSSSLIIPAMIVYACTYPFLIFGMSKVLPNTTDSSIIMILFSLYLFFGFCAVLLSNNTHPVLHYVCIAIDHICITTMSLLFIYRISVSTLFPKYFILFSITVVVLSLLFSFAFGKILFRVRKIPLPISDIRTKNQSFLIRNIMVLEWAYILSIFLNHFALGIVVLQHL
jgi:hypothetical protein